MQSCPTGIQQTTSFVVEGRMKESFFGEDGLYHDDLVMGIIL